MPVVTHIVTRAITLEGTAYEPNRVEPDEQHGRQGKLLEADNGLASVVTTGTARRLRYVWEQPDPQVFDALLALAALGSVTLTDHNGDTWEAVIPISSPTWGITHGDVSSTEGTTYTVTCAFWETTS